MFKNIRLNLKQTMRPSSRYQSENYTIKENQEQLEDDQQRLEIQPPTTKDKPTLTLQGNELPGEQEGLLDRYPQQPLAHYMQK